MLTGIDTFLLVLYLGGIVVSIVVSDIGALDFDVIDAVSALSPSAAFDSMAACISLMRFNAAVV